MNVLLVSSAGGHFSELRKINLDKKYKKTIVVEKTKTTENKADHYLIYSTRNNLIKYTFIFIINFIKAFFLIIYKRPKLIISTGAHSCVPFFYIARVFRIKTIYIESYAKVYTPSLTYKLIKKITTKIIIQHKELKETYKDSEYFGGIY